MDTKSHIGYLDGWRGLAILIVLQAHFAQTHYVETGRLGVDIFFSLSGLLMAEILFLKRMPLGLFYWRRVSRILPAFLAFVCAIYATYHLLGRGHSWEDFAATLTFLRAYVPVSPGLWETDLPIGHLWSLNVEEHCYLLMSLLTLPALLLPTRRAAAALFALAAASIAIHVVYLRWWAPTDWRLHTEVNLAGILFAAGYRLVRFESVPGWIPAVTLVGAILCYVPGLPWWADGALSPLLLAFTANHLRDAPFRGVLETKALRLCGAWSFSLYLWQQPFQHMKTSIGVLPGLAMTFAIGLMSYYWLERPARAWINGLKRPPEIRQLAEV